MGKCRESLCVYGPSGVGKTTQVMELALYTRARFGKATRLVSCTGGGWSSIQPAIDEGLVLPTFIADRLSPVETVDRLSKGWWPADPMDPSSPLVPPEKQPSFDGIGATAFDCGSEICEWFMQSMIAKEAAGQIRMSTEGLAARFKDGDTNYATPSRAHYGTIQNLIAAFIRQSKGLTDQYVLWTFLEQRGQDENTRVPVYGPAIIGQKKSDVAPAWFDDTLHLCFIPVMNNKSKELENERRMYLTQHTVGDDPVPFLAKTRIPSGVKRPDFLVGSQFSMYQYLSILEKSNIEGREQLKQRLNEVSSTTNTTTKPN